MAMTEQNAIEQPKKEHANDHDGKQDFSRAFDDHQTVMSEG